MKRKGLDHFLNGSFRVCLAHIRPGILKPVSRVFEISTGLAQVHGARENKQGSEDDPQNEKAGYANKTHQTRKGLLWGQRTHKAKVYMNTSKEFSEQLENIAQQNKISERLRQMTPEILPASVAELFVAKVLCVTFLALSLDDWLL